MMKVKYYTCPVCKKKFKTLNGWGEHVDKIHPGQRPEGFSVSRYFYFLKTGKTAGKCRTCKGPTMWNEKSMKYNVFCDNPQCKEAYVKIAKSRMVSMYGKEYILDDPDVQRNMLSHRKISGKYQFDDGTLFGYVGSYERKFLEMLDKLLGWNSSDLFSPSPHTYFYELDGEKRFYIPDFYIPSLNLEIEIKQQTSTNRAFNEANRPKEEMKDRVMSSNKNVNYLKINDNNFTSFFDFIENFKARDPEIDNNEKYDKLSVASESVIESDSLSFYDIIDEWFVTGKDGVENACVRIKGIPYILRKRSEMLIIRGDEIFINFRRKGGYSFPGGGFNKNELPIDTAIRETKEEVRIIVSDVKAEGSRHELFDEIPDWMKEKIPKNSWWRGAYSDIFVGTFNSKYTGEINKEDQDNMINTGEFRKISEVYNDLLPCHQQAITNYLNDVSQEAYFINKPDLFYRINDIYENKTNICFVTGQSGSGKSTLGAEFSDTNQTDNVKWISLDWVIWNKEYFDMDYFKKNLDILYRFFTGVGKDYFASTKEELDEFSKNHPGVDYMESIVRNFVFFAMDYAKKNPHMKLLIEGIWLYFYFKPEELQNYPVIIKGTSAFTSLIRGFKRDYLDAKETLTFSAKLRFVKQYFTKILKDHVTEEKKIKKFRDFYEKKEDNLDMAMESTIPVIKKIEKYYKEKGIKSGIGKKGEWGLDAFESGKSDTLFILGNPDFKNIAKDLRKIIGEGYTITEDNYNTLFLKKKSNSSIESLISLGNDLEAMEEANYSSKNKYPIFIVLQHNGTTFSNIIKRVTKDEFTHACISFNPNLTPLYSFGSKGKGLLHNGFVQQDGPNDVFYQDRETKFSVYVMYISKFQYEEMKRRLEYFIQNEDVFKYSVLNCVKCWFGKKSKESNKYFCSYFVMDVINSGRENNIHASLYKPQDLVNLDDISLINYGDDFKKYSISVTMKNLKRVQERKFNEIAVEAIYHSFDIYGKISHDKLVNELIPHVSEIFPNVSNANIAMESSLTLRNCITVACFAGVGKNYAIDFYSRNGLIVNSVDKERDFYKRFETPQKYQNYIRSLQKNSDILLIPYWLGMEDRYIQGKFDYHLVFPKRELKYEYIRRFKELGFTSDQIDYLSDNWDNMMDDCEKSPNGISIGKGEFLKDKIDQLINARTTIGSTPATESFFSLFKNNRIDSPESWASKLFSVKFAFGTVKPFSSSRVKIEKGTIEIKGINYACLKNRIKKFYDDNSIYNLFLPKYNALSYRRFKRKKIQRSEIKIEYLYTEEFFALELAKLFMDLGKRFKDKNYIGISNTIYENSWLSIADNKANDTPLLSTARLSNIQFTLNDYQIDFIQKYPKLKAQLNLNGYILAFEQGLGKTLTSIGLSECLDVDHVYIVCPNSLKENWALEIRKYYQEYSEDEDLWRQEVFICSDNQKFFNPNATKFMIINNESIEKMLPYVMQGKNMMILDESHNFRNVNSKRVQQLLGLRDKLKCSDILVMSGTPIKATPDEIVPALLLIDPTFTMEAAKIFSKAFKLHSSLGTSVVQARFGKIIYRKEKDVLEGKLPEKFIENLPLKISEGDKYINSNVTEVVMRRFWEIYDSGYKEMKKLEDPFFNMSKKYASSMEDFNRFKGIIKIVVKRDEYPHEIDQIFSEEFMKNAKSKMRSKEDKNRYDFLIKNYVRYKNHCLGLAFGEILPPYRRDMFISLYDENQELIHKMINENSKKTLIFSQFKGVANFINDSLNKNDIGSVLITGDVKNRMEILREFKENDAVRVLVATSQTIGTGVTLIEANQMFFFGPPWRDSDFEQCSDRIHRIGQTDDCYIYTVTLDTGDQLNLSTRMDNILKWSKEMTQSVIIKTDDSEDLDNVDFEELIKTQESTLISEFLSEKDHSQLIVRDIIANESFNDYFVERENFTSMDYVSIRPVKKDTILQEKAIVQIPGKGIEQTLLMRELMNSPALESNVVLERNCKDGITYWNLISSKDISPGEILKYKVK